MRYIQLRMEGTYRRWKLRGLAGSNVYGEQLYDLVSVEKGRTGKVQIVYQLNDVESGENIKSVWIELPQ